MRKWGRIVVPGLTLLTLALSPARPARAAGFSIETQGAKAMGMAGAFAAQADDTSAIYYNPGAVAFLKKKMAIGFSPAAANDGHYQGQPPGLGAGTTGNQNRLFTLPAQAYLIKPLAPTVKLGIGVYSPFGFRTGWQDPANFPGRTVSTAAELKTYDANATLAIQVTPTFGLGAGVVYRNAEFQQRKGLQALNPLSGSLVDVASLSVKTDYDRGAGWTAGFLHQLGPLSWGIAFPGEATLGIALAATETFVIEADVNRTGWKKFTGLALNFPNNPTLSASLQGPWKDTNSYRLGVRLGPARGPQWRFGYALEQTPQPDESVNPFLPDGARSIVGIGFGIDWLDLAFQWEKPADRSTFVSRDQLNGTYRGSIYRFGITISPM